MREAGGCIYKLYISDREHGVKQVGVCISLIAVPRAWREAGGCICKLDISGRERGVKQVDVFTSLIAVGNMA